MESKSDGLVRLLVLAATLSAVAQPGLSAQEMQLQPGSLLMKASGILDVGDYAIPCVADWNADGRKDLLIGYRYADKIAVFLNDGTDANPSFAEAVNLQAAGADIVHASAGCGAPAPFVCDYDHDGKHDLLVGAGLDGTVHFYRNIGTGTAPELGAGVKLLAGGAVLSVGSRATPCVWDWDADGLDDLVCGTGDGWIVWFRNTGTAGTPAYAAGTRIRAGATDLNPGIRSVPRFHDWDRDGLPDLVCSSTSGVYWCRNVGSRSAPVLSAMSALKAPIAAGGLVPVNTGARMRLDLVDWDKDGATDLLVGNADGTVSLFPGYRFALDICCDAPGVFRLMWASAPYLSYRLDSGDVVGALTNTISLSLPSAGKVTSWTNSASDAQKFFRVRIWP